MRIIGCLILFAAVAFGRTEFWTPANPPHATYIIDARIYPDAGRLKGSETVQFRNTTSRPIGRLAFSWEGDQFRLRANGAEGERVPGVQSPVLFELPKDIAPGDAAELRAEFAVTRPAWKGGQGGATADWYPRLWWGIGTHDDYEVRVEIPKGLTVAASGRLQDGVYRANGVRAFALFVGRGYESAEAAAGAVRVRAVFTPKGSRCAQILLKTAVDAIGFYQGRFGFYPHNSLTIIPGSDAPVGGYPIATAMVAIHGQERFGERSEAWWQWITAHEIGHMYWSEHILAQGPDSLDWLMVGLGIYADREYRRSRGITDAGELWKTYVSGVGKGYDTTLDVTPEQLSRIKWDFNNVVLHGKSSAALNALESVIGAKTFDTVYQRCLRDYAGKPLGWREFQRVVESESGQNLEWFFEQWVRSSAYVDYKTSGQECGRAAEAFGCAVHIRREGTMRMPVTVAARFEDGTEQRSRTERLADDDTLRFQAASPLKAVVIEPESAVAMAEPPPPKATDMEEQIDALPWTGAGDDALRLYHRLQDLGAHDDGAWMKLALLMYDGKHYAEALEALRDLGSSTDAEIRFFSLVWQGHILDILGKRGDAVASYESALKVPGEPKMQHSQYGITIDKKWVEERLKTPFAR